MNKIIFLLGFVFTLSFSCTKNELGIVTGMKPLYVDTENYNEIKAESAKPFIVVGKIFKIGNRIFISDKGSGVHVIDNSMPSAPIKESFISIYGNNDMAVKENIMYADNGDDLVALNISDLNSVTITKRLEDVYNFNATFFPIDHSGYFECADPEKGTVYDWVEAELDNPKCQR